MFFANSFLLGIGLSIDAFSISIANGLNEQNMPLRRSCLIAGIYAFFQFIMPMIGWFCVHSILSIFSAFQKCIPWIALVLLLYIGGKMLLESVSCTDKSNHKPCTKKCTFAVLLLQGVATSIDALSVGFTIADYNALSAFTASLIIASVTFGLCQIGLLLGKKTGPILEKKAGILGGLMLIAIGIEIFIKGVF